MLISRHCLTVTKLVCYELLFENHLEPSCVISHPIATRTSLNHHLDLYILTGFKCHQILTSSDPQIRALETAF